MIVTLFKHTTDTVGERVELDFSKPLPRSIPKKDLPLWSATVFNGPRCIPNAVEVNGLTYDVDIDPVPDQSIILAEVSGVSGELMSSSGAAIAKPRWRLKLDTDKPIP